GALDTPASTESCANACATPPPVLLTRSTAPLARRSLRSISASAPVSCRNTPMLTVPVGSIVDWRSTSALPLRAHSGKRTWSESGRIGDAVQGGGDVRPVGDKAVA